MPIYDDSQFDLLGRMADGGSVLLCPFCGSDHGLHIKSNWGLQTNIRCDCGHRWYLVIQEEGKGQLHVFRGWNEEDQPGGLTTKEQRQLRDFLRDQERSSGEL